jgi:hypothetical protein
MKKTPNQTKVYAAIVLGALCFILLFFIILRGQNKPAQTTQTVGKSSYQSDPRSYPDYKADENSHLTILNPEKLSPPLEKTVIPTVEGSGKIYDIDSSLPTVASVVSKPKQTGNNVTFDIVTDANQSRFTVTVVSDGSNVTVKKISK